MRERNQTLRKKAFERDNFTCQKCKVQDKTAKILEAHHITPLYMEKIDNLDNLITLCHNCHKYAPDDKKEFEKYMEDEIDGTATRLIMIWKKERQDHPELFEQINKEEKINNIIKMSSRPKNSTTLKQQIFERDKFKCQKCDFLGTSEDLEVYHVKMRVDEGDNALDNLITLCSICHHYAPNDIEEFKIYLNEKIDGNLIDTFRKSQKNISKRNKNGMSKTFRDGNLVTKPPLGYKIENKQLIPGEHSYVVQEIYQDFLNNTISLTQLSKKYGLSVNGLKKVLMNYTYLGKVKFDGEIIQGKHQPLLSSTLFNQVQDKLKKILK